MRRCIRPQPHGEAERQNPQPHGEEARRAVSNHVVSAVFLFRRPNAAASRSLRRGSRLKRFPVRTYKRPASCFRRRENPRSGRSSTSYSPKRRYHPGNGLWPRPRSRRRLRLLRSRCRAEGGFRALLGPSVCEARALVQRRCPFVPWPMEALRVRDSRAEPLRPGPCPTGTRP